MPKRIRKQKSQAKRQKRGKLAQVLDPRIQRPGRHGKRGPVEPNKFG